jgi:hypothetical protein
VSPTIRATPLLVGNAMKLSVGGVLMLVSLFEIDLEFGGLGLVATFLTSRLSLARTDQL